MTAQQQKIIDNASKGKLKNEGVLGGGSTYINPKRILKPKSATVKPKAKK